MDHVNLIPAVVVVVVMCVYVALIGVGLMYMGRYWYSFLFQTSNCMDPSFGRVKLKHWLLSLIKGWRVLALEESAGVVC